MSNAILAVIILFFVFWGVLHKNVLYKVSALHSEGLSKNCMSEDTLGAICK